MPITSLGSLIHASILLGAGKMAEQPAYVMAGLKQIAIEQGFTASRFRIEFGVGSNKGDGFMGTLVKAIFHEEGRDELTVLVKVMPEHKTRKQQAIGMFEREVMVYNTVFPMLKKFQAEKGFSEEKGEGFWRVPKCYYAKCDSQKMEAMVVMEDLREKKFRMWNRFQTVDYGHISILMEQLGKLHAVSFAMKEQQPEKFAQFKKLDDPMKTMIEKDPRKSINKLFEELLERALGTISDEEEKVKDAMEKLKGQVTDSYVECVDAVGAEPYSIIGHGDCWVNNMMYTYDGDASTPTDIRLIDWQVCRYGSPILDLSYFIFICTDEEFREKHFVELLDVYYKSLGDYLKRLGGDVERQFPKIAFQDHWKKYGRFGFLMGLILLPMVCTPTDELPSMDEYVEKIEKEEKNVKYEYGTSEKAYEMYRNRMAGAIRDIVKFKYL